MELISQKMRSLAPELDPLRLGTGWKPEDLAKPQIIVESTFGDSHPGSGHLDKLVAAACEGVAPEAMVRDTLLLISVMARVRAPMESISVWQAVK